MSIGVGNDWSSKPFKVDIELGGRWLLIVIFLGICYLTFSQGLKLADPNWSGPGDIGHTRMHDLMALSPFARSAFFFAVGGLFAGFFLVGLPALLIGRTATAYEWGVKLTMLRPRRRYVWDDIDGYIIYGGRRKWLSDESILVRLKPQTKSPLLFGRWVPLATHLKRPSDEVIDDLRKLSEEAKDALHPVASAFPSSFHMVGDTFIFFIAPGLGVLFAWWITR